VNLDCTFELVCADDAAVSREKKISVTAVNLLHS